MWTRRHRFAATLCAVLVLGGCAGNGPDTGEEPAAVATTVPVPGSTRLGVKLTQEEADRIGIKLATVGVVLEALSTASPSATGEATTTPSASGSPTFAP